MPSPDLPHGTDKSYLLKSSSYHSGVKTFSKTSRAGTSLFPWHSKPVSLTSTHLFDLTSHLPLKHPLSCPFKCAPPTHPICLCSCVFAHMLPSPEIPPHNLFTSKRHMSFQDKLRGHLLQEAVPVCRRSHGISRINT